jgi:hypothetical protein
VKNEYDFLCECPDCKERPEWEEVQIGCFWIGCTNPKCKTHPEVYEDGSFHDAVQKWNKEICKEKESRIDELKRLAEPLIDFLYRYYHPHATIMITQADVEVVEGDMAFVNELRDKMKEET